MKAVNIVVLSALAMLFSASSAFADTVARSLPVEGETIRLIIKKTPSFKAQAFSDKVVKQSDDYEVMEVKAEDASAIMAALETNKDVESVEIGYLASTPEPISETPAYIPGITSQGMSGVPNDYLYTDQVHWKNYTDTYRGHSNIEAAYLVADQTRKAKIAVLDAGFRDSSDMVWKGGFNFSTIDASVPRGSVYKDYNGQDCTNGHGQAVGEIIGAITNNGEGTAGIVNADMYAVRVLGCGSEGYLDEAAEGVRWAAGDPNVENAASIGVDIDVINMSLGARTATCPSYMQSAIDYAVGKGIAVVVAAGNNGEDVSNFTPANCNNVITVASVDDKGSQSNFSNHGSLIDISALGEPVLSAGTGSGYSYWVGTSFASPVQAGMIALAKLVDSTLTPMQLEEYAKITANPLNTHNNAMGAGVGNAKGILDKTNEMLTTSPVELKNILKTGERCDENVYLNGNSTAIDACRIFEVKINDLPMDGVYNTYVVFEVDKGLPLTVSNGMRVKAVSNEYPLIKDLAPNMKEYGIQLCTDDTGQDCKADELVDLRASEVALPEACDV